MKKLFISFFLLLLAACNVEKVSQSEGVHPIFDPQAFESGNYFAIPFPHYLRVNNGKIDIHDFPGVEDNTMLRRVAKQLEENFTGFGLESEIIVPFSGDISDKSISVPVTDTISGKSSVLLIDIDPDSHERGRKIPILMKFYRGVSKYLPVNSLLAIPEPGYHLRENTWYALIIKKGLKDSEGNDVVAPDKFEKLMYQNSFPYSLVKKVVHGEDVIFAVPFKTGIISTQLQKIADWYKNVSLTYEVDPYTYEEYWWYDTRYEIEGKVKLPQFQSGTPPYLEEGSGAFVFDKDGNPVPQRWEWVRFSILFPRFDQFPMPEKGYPIVIYAHGTGGDYHTYIWDWVGYYLTSMGYAVIGFDQPLHGTRNPKNGGEDLYTFNFINPVAMRDNIRQGAVDLFGIRKLVETIKFDKVDTPEKTAYNVFFDKSRINFFGHSQGALTGGLYLAFENYPLRGAILSGSSGDLILAFLYKTAPVRIPDLFKIFLDDNSNYTLFNPILSLFQTLGDPADPINVGERIIYHKGLPTPRNIFISEGLEDKETPPPQIEAFAYSVGVTPVTPIYHLPLQFKLAGVKPLQRPVSGNLYFPGGVTVTVTLTQYPGYGHFACFDSQDAIDDWTGFMESLLRSSTATLK